MLGATSALRVAMAAVLVLPVLRVALWLGAPSYRDFMDQSFETVADAVAIGCVLAGLRPSLGRWPLYRALLGSRAIVLVPVLVVLVNAQEGHPIAFMLVGETVMNAGIAVIIDWSLRNPNGYVGAVFESRPARFVGIRSYSLYLWQQPFLDHRATALATSFPLNVALACAAALLSYALIERPSSKLRAKFAR